MTERSHEVCGLSSSHNFRKLSYTATTLKTNNNDCCLNYPHLPKFIMKTLTNIEAAELYSNHQQLFKAGSGIIRFTGERIEANDFVCGVLCSVDQLDHKHIQETKISIIVEL